MPFLQELSSWAAVPRAKASTIPAPPVLGGQAPTTPKIPLEPGQPSIICFLRHCGCPFAEKTYLNLRETAIAHRHIAFVAVSHSAESATDAWLRSLPQHSSEPANLVIVVDEDLEAYAAWGLGPSSYAHVVSPWALWDVWRLGRDENIWNRPTESGSRWQTSGFWAVDAEGVVRWGRRAVRASDVPDFEDGVRALERAEGQ